MAASEVELSGSDASELSPATRTLRVRRAVFNRELLRDVAVAAPALRSLTIAALDETISAEPDDGSADDAAHVTLPALQVLEMTKSGGPAGEADYDYDVGDGRATRFLDLRLRRDDGAGGSGGGAGGEAEGGVLASIAGFLGFGPGGGSDRFVPPSLPSEAALCNLVSACPALTHLILDDTFCGLGDCLMRVLATRCSHLQVLRLSRNLEGVGDGMWHLSDATLGALGANCPRLEVVDVHWADGLTATGILALLRAAPTLCVLRCIASSSTASHMTQAESSTGVDATTFPALRELDVSCSDATVVTALATALVGSAPALEALTLRPAAPALAVLSSLAATSPRLRFLSIGVAAADADSVAPGGAGGGGDGAGSTSVGVAVDDGCAGLASFKALEWLGCGAASEKVVGCLPDAAWSAFGTLPALRVVVLTSQRVTAAALASLAAMPSLLEARSYNCEGDGRAVAAAIVARGGGGDGAAFPALRRWVFDEPAWAPMLLRVHVNGVVVERDAYGFDERWQRHKLADLDAFAMPPLRAASRGSSEGKGAEAAYGDADETASYDDDVSDGEPVGADYREREALNGERMLRKLILRLRSPIRAAERARAALVDRSEDSSRAPGRSAGEVAWARKALAALDARNEAHAEVCEDAVRRDAMEAAAPGALAAPNAVVISAASHSKHPAGTVAKRTFGYGDCARLESAIRLARAPVIGVQMFNVTDVGASGGVVPILTALSASPLHAGMLRVLSFRHCALQLDGYEAIARALPALPALRVLAIVDDAAAIPETAVADVLESALTHCPQLITLLADGQGTGRGRGRGRGRGGAGSSIDGPASGCGGTADTIEAVLRCLAARQARGVDVRPPFSAPQAQAGLAVVPPPLTPSSPLGDVAAATLSDNWMYTLRAEEADRSNRQVWAASFPTSRTLCISITEHPGMTPAAVRSVAASTDLLLSCDVSLALSFPDPAASRGAIVELAAACAAAAASMAEDAAPVDTGAAGASDFEAATAAVPARELGLELVLPWPTTPARNELVALSTSMPTEFLSAVAALPVDDAASWPALSAVREGAAAVEAAAAAARAAEEAARAAASAAEAERRRVLDAQRAALPTPLVPGTLRREAAARRVGLASAPPRLSARSTTVALGVHDAAAVPDTTTVIVSSRPFQKGLLHSGPASSADEAETSMWEAQGRCLTWAVDLTSGSVVARWRGLPRAMHIAAATRATVIFEDHAAGGSAALIVAATPSQLFRSGDGHVDVDFASMPATRFDVSGSDLGYLAATCACDDDANAIVTVSENRVSLWDVRASALAASLRTSGVHAAGWNGGSQMLLAGDAGLSWVDLRAASPIVASGIAADADVTGMSAFVGAEDEWVAGTMSGAVVVDARTRRVRESVRLHGTEPAYATYSGAAAAIGGTRCKLHLYDAGSSAQWRPIACLSAGASGPDDMPDGAVGHVTKLAFVGGADSAPWLAAVIGGDELRAWQFVDDADDAGASGDGVGADGGWRRPRPLTFSLTKLRERVPRPSDATAAEAVDPDLLARIVRESGRSATALAAVLDSAGLGATTEVPEAVWKPALAEAVSSGRLDVVQELVNNRGVSASAVVESVPADYFSDFSDPCDESRVDAVTGVGAAGGAGGAAAVRGGGERLGADDDDDGDDVAEPRGLSVLEMALRHWKLDIAEWLIEAGADPTREQPTGYVPATLPMTVARAQRVRDEVAAAHAAGDARFADRVVSKRDFGITSLDPMFGSLLVAVAGGRAAICYGDDAGARERIVRALLTRGADPNQAAMGGWTSLTKALRSELRRRDAGVVVALLLHGARVDVVSPRDGSSPLAHACALLTDADMPAPVAGGAGAGDGGDHTNRTDASVSLKLDVPASRIGVIIGRGGSSIRDVQERSGASLALSAGSRDQPTRDLTISGSLRAVAAARASVCELIGADHVPSDDMFCACALLLERGAAADAADAFGRPALHLVASRGSAAGVRFLVAADADPNAWWRLPDGGASCAQVYPGRAARRRGPAATAVGEGERLDVEHDESPLMAAQNVEVARALLAAGADPCAASPRGAYTALHHYAAGAAGAVAALCEAVLAAGCGVNALTAAGATALHLAVEAGKADVIRLLRRAGADETVRAAGAGGKTAAELAVGASAHVRAALADAVADV
mmetsp:Transcript_18153/g.64294  ORF Transcript_18153/g.64294 Transcript_18153/m.64294 type:complete len:2157 (-) Transcript_18153:115-6585(-)